MYKGTLWLEYSDEESEAHYRGKIVRFIKRDTEVSFDFQGSDCDEGRFTGHCKAKLNSGYYTGAGTFSYSDGTTINARVIFSIKEEHLDLYLQGEWQDDGNALVYSLFAELSNTMQ